LPSECEQRKITMSEAEYNTAKNFNYHKVPFKCCNTCKFSAVDTTAFADCDPLYCKHKKNKKELVSWNGVCDLHEFNTT